jgi:hypothetical protein
MTNAVFDQTINRAAQIVQRLGWAHLPIWHEKTRIAVRVPLETIHSVLETRPSGQWRWVGGVHGGWQPDSKFRNY